MLDNIVCALCRHEADIELTSLDALTLNCRFYFSLCIMCMLVKIFIILCIIIIIYVLPVFGVINLCVDSVLTFERSRRPR